MNLLLILSLHGSLAFVLVWGLDRALAGHMSAQGRRWWWLAVPLSFLVSIPLPFLPPLQGLIPVGRVSAPVLMARANGAAQGAFQAVSLHGNAWIMLWLGGAALYLVVVFAQTRAAIRRWSGERLSTDSALLELLEDCKQAAGVTAPIGLVCSDRISSPAILGWLRPRILLTQELACSQSRGQLRAIFLHELAHFRSCDVPLAWLFTLARAVHWFNPLAHLAFHTWTRFREEAADEAAITWSRESSGASYGQALLHAIKQAHGATPPFGALAIGESVHNLKRRLVMIRYYQKRSPRFLLASVVFAVIVTLFLVRPIQADDSTDAKAAAVAAMQQWLQEMDQGQYSQSWQDAAPSFQKAVSTEKWTEASNSVRTPLGKCTARVLASAMHQTEVPSPSGPQKGDFFIAQFNSSFENLAYAVETVCFEKAPDGSWKAAGYYIKPKT